MVNRSSLFSVVGSVQLARSEGLLVLFRLESEEPCGNADVRRDVLLHRNVAQPVRLYQWLPPTRLLELK